MNYPAGPGTANNKLALWSLIASLIGLVCGVGSIVGIVLGVLALNQIKQTGEGGRQLAQAGIVVGAVTLVLSFFVSYWFYF